MDTVCREREKLALNIDHVNVVKCFEATTVPPYLIVSEFCAGGSLWDTLHNSTFQLSLRQRAKVLLDVTSGMRYLHQQQPCILHRDLKSGNVLLTKDIASSCQVPVAKVSDFGLSRVASESEGSDPRNYTMGVGTWRWMAPEMFGSADFDAYNESVDVYSFGIVAYEVLAQKVPYYDLYPDIKSTDPRMGLQIMDGLRPNISAINPRYPEALVKLMEGCWVGDPEARPMFTELEPSMRIICNSLTLAVPDDPLAVPVARQGAVVPQGAHIIRL
jgi:serine/threonine protein kinase